MTLPNVDMNLLDQPTLEKIQAKALDHPPRILLLYGSNRERSYSRLAVVEAILQTLPILLSMKVERKL